MTLAFSELARVFNKNTFEEVLQGDFSYIKSLNQSFFNGTHRTLGEFYDSTYNILLKKYRSEYIFKNLIARKIVIGKHKLADITFFDEFKVWSNFVDVVVVNGVITAYEIKSEFDSYMRLTQQLETYSQVFEFVNLVLSETNISDLDSLSLPGNIGIVILSKRNTLVEKRKAKSNLINLSHEMIFSCLRKAEYESFLMDINGSLPDVKPVFLRSACLSVFKTIEIERINSFFHYSLKKRKPLIAYREYVNEVPISLSGIMFDYQIKGVEKITKLVNAELH